MGGDRDGWGAGVGLGGKRVGSGVGISADDVTQQAFL